MNALVKFEPITPPNPRRPWMIPELPEWLKRSASAAKRELQPVDGGYRDVLVLPREMLPAPVQREAMEAHIADLRLLLEQTPELSPEAETEIATAISSILMVLPSQRTSEFGEQVRAEAYLEALDDVPWWAVRGAIRAWHRHECGKDDRGQPYDYRWAPGPGTMRALAKKEVWRFLYRIQKLGEVLAAREYIDCSSQLADGKAAWMGLRVACGGGYGAVEDITFERAIELGSGKQPISDAA